MRSHKFVAYTATCLAVLGGLALAKPSVVHAASDAKPAVSKQAAQTSLKDPSNQKGMYMGVQEANNSYLSQKIDQATQQYGKKDDWDAQQKAITQHVQDAQQQVDTAQKNYDAAQKSYASVDADYQKALGDQIANNTMLAHYDDKGFLNYDATVADINGQKGTSKAARFDEALNYLNAHRSDSKETANANKDNLQIAVDNATKAASHPGNQFRAAKKALDDAKANLQKQIDYRDNVVAKGIAKYNEANKKILPEAEQNVKYAASVVDIEKGLQRDAETKAKDAADKLAKDQAAKEDALAHQIAYSAMVRSTNNDFVNKSQALLPLKNDPNAKKSAWVNRLAAAAKIVNDEYKDGLKVSDVQAKLDSATKSVNHLQNVVKKDQKDKDAADKAVKTAKNNVVRANKDLVAAQNLLKQVGGTIDNNNKDNGNSGNKGDNTNPGGNTGYVPSDNTNTTAETPASGVAFLPIINNNPNWKVNMMDANGHFTNVYLNTNTSWKVFAKKTINGIECYRLGSQQQWVPAQ